MYVHVPNLYIIYLIYLIASAIYLSAYLYAHTQRPERNEVCWPPATDFIDAQFSSVDLNNNKSTH